MPYSPNADWRTTKGNIAADLHWSGVDDALNAHAQLKAEVERNYAGAVVVGNATRAYNCHAFVHASSHAWFNDINPFLRDDYYQFTPGTLQLNDAVVYAKDGQITHSGFIIQLAGNSILKVRSKWGAFPVVEHPPSSVPAIYGGIVYYLRKKPPSALSVAEMSNDSARAEISNLLENMISKDRLKDLWLASTPEVAEMIVKNWPEFTLLQLRGDAAVDQIRQKLGETEGDALLALTILAKHSSSKELKAAAQARMGQSLGLISDN